MSTLLNTPRFPHPHFYSPPFMSPSWIIVAVLPFSQSVQHRWHGNKSKRRWPRYSRKPKPKTSAHKGTKRITYFSNLIDVIDLSTEPATPLVDWAKCYYKSRSEQDKLHEPHGGKQLLQPCHQEQEIPRRTIRVLLLSWEDDDNDFEHYIAKLEKVFMCIYNFPTHWFKIPSRSPKEFVEEKVEWFKAQCSAQRELLIVYYGGHGGFQSDNEMAFSPYDFSKREDTITIPYLLWDDLLATLEHPKSLEIVVLMDCCFAAGSIRTGYIPAASSGGVIEVIAACGFETKSYGGGISFTHALIEELISKASGSEIVFSTLDMHMGILQRTLRNREYSHEVRTPVFMRLRQNHCTDSSILLQGCGGCDDETAAVEEKILGELRECEREYWDTYIDTKDCEACGGSGRMNIDGGEAEKSVLKGVGWGSIESGDEVEKSTPESIGLDGGSVDFLPVVEDAFGDGLEEFWIMVDECIRNATLGPPRSYSRKGA